MRSFASYRPSAGFIVATVVVLVIGLVVVIPAFRPETAHRAQISCGNNLKLIELAKRQWAEDNQMAVGEQSDIQAIRRLMGESVRLECPQGGGYTFGAVGTPAHCSCGEGLLNTDATQTRP
jgi:hypothetical protein